MDPTAHVINPPPPRPESLRGIAGVLFFLGGMFSIFLVLAPLDIGTYTYFDEQVSGPEFMRRAGVLWVTFTIGSLAAGYGLWTGRWWSRYLTTAFVVTALGTAVVAAESGDRPGAVMSALPWIALLGWYFFGKENVRTYFTAEERRAMPE